MIIEGMKKDIANAKPNHRVKILRQLVEQHDSIAQFANLFDLDASYISQLLNGHRTFGEKSAAKIGVKIANNPELFDTYSIDKPTNGQVIEEPSPLPAQQDLTVTLRHAKLIALFDALPESEQDEVLAELDKKKRYFEQIYDEMSRKVAAKHK